MIKEILPKIYQIEIPLPKNPLKALNSYLIKGEEEYLLVDTGFNRRECQEVLFQALDSLEVDLKKTKVLITHLHADHSGLAEVLYSKGATLLMEPEEALRIKALSKEKNWETMKGDLKTFGLEVGKNFFDDHPGRIYAPKGDFAYEKIHEGENIVIGDYSFEVISVPGHTPGMINLFDRENRIYLSADHVLETITPNIGFWGYDQEKMLQKYLKSLRKVQEYPVTVMLPSHRGLIRKPKERIEELIAHHQERLKEVENIINGKDRPLTVEDVAKDMDWRIPAKSWGDFPPPQKSFAAGEAMSHLEYLKDHGRIKAYWKGNVIYFARNTQ
ncbi:MBL fold metallo-hydrolase [Isachenkonia alkalipeptolytica]|nr:MBL fold metallo-hydrolase [Isachenkonia alkalipeptolytica]